MAIESETETKNLKQVYEYNNQDQLIREKIINLQNGIESDIYHYTYHNDGKKIIGKRQERDEWERIIILDEKGNPVKYDDGEKYTQFIEKSSFTYDNKKTPKNLRLICNSLTEKVGATYRTILPTTVLPAWLPVKNNVISYIAGWDDHGWFSKDISYTYNEKGYPTSRKGITEEGPGGEAFYAGDFTTHYTYKNCECTSHLAEK